MRTLMRLLGLELCLQMLSCYLGIADGSVQDMSGLSVENGSRPVANLQPDAIITTSQ